MSEPKLKPHQVSEEEFIQYRVPVSLLAIHVHAMYYGEGDWANHSLGSNRIARELRLTKEQVFQLLDLADDMLALGASERKVRA